MKDLLIEYFEARKHTLQLIERCKNEEDLKVLKSIVRDIEFVIKWIETGHNPKDYKGIYTLQSYTIDHQVLEAVIDSNGYVSHEDQEDYEQLINDSTKDYKKLLVKLSQRELETFIMVKCERLKLSQVGELLGMKKGTVQTYLDRATNKLKQSVEDYEAEKLLKDCSFDIEAFKGVLKKTTYDYPMESISFIDNPSKEYRITSFLLNQMKPKERKIFLLKYCNDMKIDEISNMTKLKLERVERQLITAENIARSILGEQQILSNRIIKTSKIPGNQIDINVCSGKQRERSYSNESISATKNHDVSVKDNKFNQIDIEMLNHLSAREAEVFQLIYFSNYSRNDAADHLDVKLGTIDSLLSRARKKLNNYIDSKVI